MIKWAQIEKSSGKIPTNICSISKIALVEKQESQQAQDPA